MPARPSRTVVTFAVSVIVSLMGAVLLLAAPANATAPSSAAGPSHTSASESAAPCVLPKASDDDTISIIGRICDRRETPAAPVEGVDFTVEDSSGNPVGEATSAADGTFEVPLPGTSVENLGKEFVVVIDEETLPEGAALTNGEDLERSVRINLDNDVSITFPVGENPNSVSGKLTQAVQLVVGGLVFSVLLAMAALGLSVIFGTTGLTNFAHGELITFGAIIAYAVDQLPGAIRIGGLNLTRGLRRRSSPSSPPARSAGSTTPRCGSRCGAAAPASSR